MGSNLIDFTKKRFDHDLQDLVLYEPHIDSLNYTALWSDYRTNPNPPARICGQNEIKTATQSNHGTFVVVEAENVTLASNDPSLLRDKINKVLGQLGFTKIAIHDLPNGPTTNNLAFFFEEGYVAIRVWPEHQYCSIDLQLWNSIALQDQVVAELVAAVGGDRSESTTSFQISTGGMQGTSNPITSSSIEVAPTASSVWCDMADGVTEWLRVTNDAAITNDAVNDVMGELASLFPVTDPLLMVLCPDSTSSCKSLDAASSHHFSTRILPIHACPDITGGVQSALLKCEMHLLKLIQEAVSSNKDGISGIILDSNAPRELGQIFHRIFADSTNSYELLSSNYTILAPTIDPKDVSQWRYHLLERFRIDIVEFNPEFHATIFFNSTESSGSLKFGIFSVGNTNFYADLIKVFAKVEQKTELSAEIRESRQGLISNIPDYKPSKFASTADYDMEPSYKQWSSQRQVGAQVISQYEYNTNSRRQQLNCLKLKKFVPQLHPGASGMALLGRQVRAELWPRLRC